MKLFKVDSHMVEAVGYDADSLTLQVAFSGGRTYNYEEVPPEVWEALTNTESVGNYILEHVMNVYPDHEVK